MKKKNEANHRSDCDEPAGEIITAGPEVAARRAQIDVRPGPHGKHGPPPPAPPPLSKYGSLANCT